MAKGVSLAKNLHKPSPLEGAIRYLALQMGCLAQVHSINCDQNEKLLQGNFII